MSILTSIFKKSSVPSLAKVVPVVERVNTYEKQVRGLPDAEFPRKTEELKQRVRKGADLEEIMPYAFALVREAARRTLGQRHYDVQIMGGVVLARGGIAEMKTGEGKTLVATLPAYLYALRGLGVHVVTVNDYLSRRDAVWMGQIYNFLGMSVGVINHDTSYIYDESAALQKDTERDHEGAFRVVYEFLRPVSRKEAYEADITYGTNSEFGFDYLRDNIAYDTNRLVQRGFHFALIDEIDSILIDEARTPLIISQPVQESESLYPTFARIAARLSEGEDYTVDEKLKAIQLTDSGIDKAEKALGIQNIYTDAGVKYVHHLEVAVRAKALYLKDRDYVVKNGEVIIVDPFTGRLQPGRRWSEGLHQAIEAKEGVQIKEESRTYATITYQNYFRMYDMLSGMTGTALTSAEEFHKVYNLETYVIPTHRPSARIDHPDLIFQTEKGKFLAIARKVKELYQKGQPVLLGTVSVEKNEELSLYLKKEGVPHEILNAKNHEREGEIIANAGRRGSVVLATNMAGRGVDIKLGGANATEEEYQEVKRLGGLFVIGTERHEARRIDNQLRGRAGRQGDPGETQFFISLEDSLMRVFASERIKNMMGRFGIPEDEPISNKMVARAIETAQTKIEGFNFDARKHVLEYDDVMNHQRQVIYERRRAFLMGEREGLERVYREALDHVEEEKKEKLAAELEERRKHLGEEVFWDVFRNIALQTIDMLWLEHLEAMDHLRGSVNLRAYGQRDPLVEYKKEGLRLFKDLEQSFYVYTLMSLSQFKGEEQSTASLGKKETQGIASGQRSHGVYPQKDASGKKVGRNDPCPCGSGKKFKKCHGG